MFQTKFEITMEIAKIERRLEKCVETNENTLLEETNNVFSNQLEPVTILSLCNDESSPIEIIPSILAPSSSCNLSLKRTKPLPDHTVTKQGLEIIKLCPSLPGIEEVNIKQEWDEDGCEQVTTPNSAIPSRNNEITKDQPSKQNKMVKPVFPDVIQKMKNYFQIEEQNMFYLRHPYLTAEQSAGHSKALGLPEEKFGKLLNEQRLKFKNNVTLAERLGHLRHSEPWD